MGEVHKFEPEVVGDGFRFDCDELLEAAKGQGFDRLVIIADYQEGSDIWISGSANAGESMILMERAKRHIVESD
jgi:hypothetical protein